MIPLYLDYLDNQNNGHLLIEGTIITSFHYRPHEYFVPNNWEFTVGYDQEEVIQLNSGGTHTALVLEHGFGKGASAQLAFEAALIDLHRRLAKKRANLAAYTPSLSAPTIPGLTINL